MGSAAIAYDAPPLRVDWSAYAKFRASFEEVMDPRRYEIEWLDQQILSGAAFFMNTDEAAIVFEVRTYPTGFREVHGLLAAGDMREIVSLLIPAAELWGVAHGCAAAVIESRPGWQRVLQDRGYSLHQVAVRKDM